MAWNPEGWQPDGWQPSGWQPDGAAVAADRTNIPVNSGYIAIKTPAADLYLTFDWSDALEDGQTLVSVVHSIDLPLTAANEATDTGEATSQVDIAGGSHAGMHTLTVVATLSDASTLTRRWPIRVFNG